MRWAGAALVVAALALSAAGCGAAQHPAAGGVDPSAAIASELTYFAPGSPLIASISTSAAGLAPLATKDRALAQDMQLATVAVEAKLGQLGIDYQSDVEPLFGNPIMVGINLAASPGLRPGWLAAWVTDSASRLTALIGKLHLRGAGNDGPFSLYGAGGTIELAVDGATLVAGAPSVVSAAIERHDQNDGFPAGAYAGLTGGLPTGAAIEIWGDLQQVLSRPSMAKARSVPWIGALRGYAAAVSGSAGAIKLSLRVDTSAHALTAAELPIAPGPTAPEFAGSSPITVALADPAQLVSFIEAAQRAAARRSYRRFARRQSRLRARTGTDLAALVSQLTGSLVIASDGGTTMARVGLRDPSSASPVLAKLLADPADALAGARRARSLGGGFYALSSGPRRRSSTVTIGVVGDQLVAGRASVAALNAFAEAPEEPAPGAEGSLAFRIALPSLLQDADVEFGNGANGAVMRAVLGVLGNVTGWVQASPSALTGEATLALR